MKIKLAVFLVILLAMGGSLSAGPPDRFTLNVPWDFMLSGAPQTHTFPALDTNNAFTGNNTHTGLETFNNAAGAGANDLTIGLMNRIRLWCANGAGYRFSTVESALTDITTNATQGGYVFSCPDNSTDTSPGQVEIGSATKTAAINLHPGNAWLDNTSTAHTYFLGVHNGSALFGENNGTQGGSRTGGALIQQGCSANNSYVIDTPEGQSGNGQAYSRLEHLFIQGCTTGTVGAGAPSIAALNIEALSGMNTIRDLYLTGFANATQLRIASNNNSAANQVGPLHIDNVWNACVYFTGCQPFTIMAGSSTAQGVLPMLISAGASLNPGNGVSLVKINGNSDAGAIFGGHFDAHYTEQLTNASGSLHYDINDTNNYVWTGGASGNIAADTIFDIKQSAAGRSCALTIEGHRIGNSGGTAINNHISGFTQTGKNYISFYHYGGDGTCSFFPFVIDSNKVQILNTTGVAHLIKNNLDSELDSDCDSGLTAAQNCYFRFLDRGTAQWLIGKASNIFRITDPVNNHVHVAAIQNGETDFNSYGATGMQFNVNANSTGNFKFFSGGASPAEVFDILASGALLSKGTAAVLSGTGACATFSGQVGGQFAGSAACASATAASTLTIAFSTAAPHGYACSVQDETTRANLFQQTSHTTTTAVFTATSVTQNDVFVFNGCMGF